MTTRVALMALPALALPTAPTAAAPADPAGGVPCGWFTTLDQTDSDYSRRIGVVHGGPVPVVAAVVVRLTCTVHVEGDLHSDPDAVAVTSPPTAGVAVLPPTPVAYDLVWEQYESLCSRIDVEGGGRYYYDADAGTWGTSPHVPCAGGPPDATA